MIIKHNSQTGSFKNMFPLRPNVLNNQYIQSVNTIRDNIKKPDIKFEQFLNYVPSNQPHSNFIPVCCNDVLSIISKMQNWKPAEFYDHTNWFIK